MLANKIHKRWEKINKTKITISQRRRINRPIINRRSHGRERTTGPSQKWRVDSEAKASSHARKSALGLYPRTHIPEFHDYCYSLIGPSSVYAVPVFSIAVRRFLLGSYSSNSRVLLYIRSLFEIVAFTLYKILLQQLWQPTLNVYVNSSTVIIDYTMNLFEPVRCSTTSVSYTHLDVYKRQVIMNNR